MKKFFIFGLFFIVGLFSLNAQDLYFDIGVGVGGAGVGWTKFDGEDLIDPKGFDVTIIDLGVKAGFGPIANIPIYFVGSFGFFGHRISDSRDYIQFNSFLAGGGLIFYPIPLIQLAASAGYSFIANDSSLPFVFFKSESGYAFDVSAAVDAGLGKHAVLAGLRYFCAVNTLETFGVEQKQSGVTLFVRYAYREKR